MNSQLKTIFEKTIVGQMYFLRKCSFTDILYSKNTNKYTEIFMLKNGLYGVFDFMCDKYYGYNINAFPMSAKLTISNKENSNVVLTEVLNIFKPNFISHTHFHYLFEGDNSHKKLDIKDVSEKLLQNLLDKTDEEIITSSVCPQNSKL